VSGRRSAACSSRSSPRLGAVVRLRVSRCVPCGTPPRPLPVKTPGDDDNSVTLRRASAWSGWWTPTPRYRCHTSKDVGASKGCRRLLSCNQQFSMSTRESLRLPICSRRAPLLDSAPAGPAALRGQVLRRCRETPPRRGFGAEDSDDGAVGPRRRSWSGASRSERFSFGTAILAWTSWGHANDCCAGRIFCGPVPNLFATDAPAHHPQQSLGMLRVVRTPLIATHHVTSVGVRSAFHRWVSLPRRAASRHDRFGTRPPVASDMLFTRCAARQVRLGLTT